MKLSNVFLLTLALSNNVQAQDFKVVGTVEQNLHSAPNVRIAPQGTSKIAAPVQSKKIKLLKIELSQSGLDSLNKRANQPKVKPLLLASTLPQRVELGMNKVPVLDQGAHGSCVTFANTAAVDAALDMGDYISQVCQLQLGKYLAENGYYPNGWDGSNGRYVLNQMETFGIVNKDNQKNIGCAGVTEYPTSSGIPEGSMALEPFHQLSESINEKAAWSPILDMFTAMDRVDTEKVLRDVKTSLNEKDRVTFGVLLLDFDLGTAGAVGTRNSQFDTWVLTPEIARDIYLRPNFGGHEMIITGYDDSAVATDDKGNPHKGLLTLRNSWGDNVGDKGNFYMSYDYFRVLVIEAQRIRTMQADGGVDSDRG